MATGIREIILDYFRNDLRSKSVMKKFAAWAGEEPGGEEKENAFREIWEGIDVRADDSTERSFDRLSATIRTASCTPGGKPVTILRKIYRAAAILTLPLVSAGLTWYIMQEPRECAQEFELVECVVPYGEIRTVVLPDSSVVKINSGSILIHPKDFTTGRDVFLNGEAYFSVARDEARPFTVRTGEMDVKVLGTVFDVSAYSDGETVSTTLESGKVDVTFKNTDGGTVSLDPRERISLDKRSGRIDKSFVNVRNVTAWTEGNMVIRSMSINEVAKCIERRYNIRTYINSNRYEDECITMKVDGNETVDDIMGVLKILVPGLKYRIQDDALYIY